MTDYIIVGAGSAGCVLANRLSANPNNQVVLLEAGPRDWNPFIHMPAGLAKLTNFKSINWAYDTQPEPHLNNRRLYWPRGKVLGGSSSINAMCYARGHRKDYDLWASEGNEGWSFDDVLPYFKRAEDQSRGASEYHGVGGPLSVEDLRHHNPLSDVFLAATKEQGYPQTDDFNGARQRGFGFYQVTQKNGQRCSAAAGYLAPARERANLKVITGAYTKRVLFDGQRAIGIEYERKGKAHNVYADQEVILSAGAINSPQILMLSGVGDGAQLAKANLKAHHELPGVGSNLQDHLDICTLYQSTSSLTYDSTNDVAIGLRYMLFRDGIGSSNIAEAGGFLASALAADDRPDLQFHFVPAMLDDHGRNKLPGNGFTLHCCPLRPQSVGHLELDPENPAGPAKIFANYLSAPEDLRLMLEGVRISRDIFSASSFDPYRGEEIFPGSDKQSKEEIIEFIRAKSESIYHPVGTCKMGQDDMSVVDAHLRVRGLDGLRVVDASVMPRLISGNTNAPTIMIAEKASDMILAHAPAQSADAA